MEQYTILIVPEDHSNVRRFQLGARRARRLLQLGGVLLVLMALGGVDYVRARLDTRELSTLRTETLVQREELERVQGELGDLQQRLARLRELEHKVRVIADLPRVSTGRSTATIGVGGAEGEVIVDVEPEDSDLPGSEPEPGAAQAVAPEPHAALDDPSAPLAVRAARMQLHAEHLSALAAAQETSLAELVDQLKGKSRRLASTPSIWPTKGWVTSGHGYRTSPFTGQRHFHAGIDVATRPGTDIVAPARGRVIFVGRKGPLGQAVIIDHGYGTRTTYGHTKEVFVHKGEEVERGERIASVGNTGRSTGPHLHYSVNVDGRSVNPMNYIFE